MKLISWNVNGLRAVLNKGALPQVLDEEPDVLCIQETKMLWWQQPITLPGYMQFWNSAVRKGYSGTAIFTRKAPMSVQAGMDDEGRVLILEFANYFLVNCYTPNSKGDFSRLSMRQQWDKDFLAMLKKLEETKPVVVCGDLNCAYRPADVWDEYKCSKYPGCQPEEREGFTSLALAGFMDTYRVAPPNSDSDFTWWSYRYNARSVNHGMRLDYFLASIDFLPKTSNPTIYKHITGSDHCPVGLTVEE